MGVVDAIEDTAAVSGEHGVEAAISDLVTSIYKKISVHT